MSKITDIQSILVDGLYSYADVLKRKSENQYYKSKKSVLEFMDSNGNTFLYEKENINGNLVTRNYYPYIELDVKKKETETFKFAAVYIYDSYYYLKIRDRLKKLKIPFIFHYVTNGDFKLVYLYIHLNSIYSKLKGMDTGKGLNYVLCRLIGENGYTNENSLSNGLIYGDGVGILNKNIFNY